MRVGVFLLLGLALTSSGCSTQQVDESELDGQPGMTLEEHRSGEALAWTLAADGSVVNELGQSFHADGQVVESLVDDAASIGFFQMQASYEPADTCCDLPYFSLSITDGEMQHVVTVYENSDAPETLNELIDQIPSVARDAATDS